MSRRTTFIVAIFLSAIPSLAQGQGYMPRPRTYYNYFPHYTGPMMYGNGVRAVRPWTPYSGAQFGFRLGEGYGVRGIPSGPATYGLPPYYNSAPSYSYHRSKPTPVRERPERWELSISPEETPAPPVVVKPTRTPRPSSRETIARSVRKQELGDALLTKVDYTGALSHYRAAVLIAPDQAEPKFRLGFVLAALEQFPEAVEQFELGLEINPGWLTNEASFDQLIGASHGAEKAAIQNRAADWAKQDVRDADRLFLMGVMLHLDKNPQAKVFLETARKLSGDAEHLMAFLRTAETEVTAPVKSAAPQGPLADALSDAAKLVPQAAPTAAESGNPPASPTSSP